MRTCGPPSGPAGHRPTRPGCPPCRRRSRHEDGCRNGRAWYHNKSNSSGEEPMAFRIPTRDELQRLAEQNHFTLSGAEIEAYHTLLAGMVPLFEQLDSWYEPPAS